MSKNWDEYTFEDDTKQEASVSAALLNSNANSSGLPQIVAKLSFDKCLRIDAVEQTEEHQFHLNSVGADKAAIKIQSWWRGQYTRILNPKAKEVRNEIRLRRMQDHILFMSDKLDRVQKLYEDERLQRMVQEETVKFLWTELQSMQEWKRSVEDQLASITQTNQSPLLRLCESAANVAFSTKNPPSTDVSFPDSGFQSTDAPHVALEDSFLSSGTTDSLETVQALSPGLVCTNAGADGPDCSLLEQYLSSLQQTEEEAEEEVLSDRSETPQPSSPLCHSAKAAEQDLSEASASAALIKSNANSSGLPQILAKPSYCICQRIDAVEQTEKHNLHSNSVGADKAAIKIQSWLRGQYTQSLNPKAKEVLNEIPLKQIQVHILFFSQKLDRVQQQYEDEKLQRMVQEEMIKFLWTQTNQSPLLRLCESAAHVAFRTKNPPSTDVSFPDSGFQSTDAPHVALEDSFLSSGTTDSLETVQALSPGLVCTNAGADGPDCSLLEQYLSSLQQTEEEAEEEVLRDGSETPQPSSPLCHSAKAAEQDLSEEKGTESTEETPKLDLACDSITRCADPIADSDLK